ncbi:hypothetical protein [Nonomuraea sp. SBT364]|nr:hypothetical protein [Nonomuraea sp. SBT364]
MTLPGPVTVPDMGPPSSRALGSSARSRPSGPRPAYPGRRRTHLLTG